jgi:hypothetical protein
VNDLVAEETTPNRGAQALCYVAELIIVASSDLEAALVR